MAGQHGRGAEQKHELAIGRLKFINVKTIWIPNLANELAAGAVEAVAMDGWVVLLRRLLQIGDNIMTTLLLELSSSALVLLMLLLCL